MRTINKLLTLQTTWWSSQEPSTLILNCILFENWLKIRPFLLFIAVPLYNMWTWWPNLLRKSCMRNTQMFVFLDCIEVFIGWRRVLDATSNLIKINLVLLKLFGHCRILLKHCNVTTYSIVACSCNLVCHK